MEEDVKIKRLFEEYASELKCDNKFMQRLENCCDAMDMVLEEKDNYKKRFGRIAAISAFSGFITGVVMMLIYPWILSLAESLIGKLSLLLPSIPISAEIMAYIIISICCILSSLSMYFMPVLSKSSK